ncbi:hypothetical protein [Nocardiopsis dassonvillei]|uniref:hypothetical protein n=1 Tax=Nocardiopsis dassonvillei TaxID=2014 RepID=UPI003F54CC52
MGDVPAVGPDETAVGEVQDDGVCRLSISLDAPPADVYEVEIAATVPPRDSGRSLPGESESYSDSAMISRRDAQDGGVLTVFIDGPPLVY